jgi:hypothetical protein
MTATARRWTPAEEARVLEIYSPEYVKAEGIAALVAAQRRVDRNARAKSDRRNAHIARHGLASATRWFSGI